MHVSVWQAFDKAGLIMEMAYWKLQDKNHTVYICWMGENVVYWSTILLRSYVDINSWNPPTIRAVTLVQISLEHGANETAHSINKLKINTMIQGGYKGATDILKPNPSSPGSAC